MLKTAKKLALGVGTCTNTKVDRLSCKVLPHFSCHTLRHTFTTRMCGVGVSIKVIQDSLGHSYVSTMLDIYSHISDTMQRQAAVQTPICR